MHAINFSRYRTPALYSVSEPDQTIEHYFISVEHVLSFCWYGMRFECALLSGVINLLKEASGICSRSWSALALICEMRIVQFTLLAVAIHCIVGFHQWSKPKETVCTRWRLLLWHETCGAECIFFIHSHRFILHCNFNCWRYYLKTSKSKCLFIPMEGLC